MPGEIRRWTPDELAKFEPFPLPESGSNSKRTAIYPVRCFYMDYRILDETEFEDFYAAIRDHGQQLEDFELKENVTGLEKGVATVRSKKSGVERSYPIGNRTIFPADFAAELEQGFFM